MRKQANALVTLSASAQKTLLMDVCKRGRIEACGLLLGSIDAAGNWHVEQVHPLRNTFDSPVYFEFAPEDLLEAELNYPGQTVGAYHSHPTGFATASSTDRQNMRRVNVDQQIPWVWLIICGPFDEGFTLLRSVRRHLGLSAESPLIAYHHYEQEGLRRIPIQLEKASTTISKDTP